MTYDELRARLLALGVTPPDVCRASLYIDYLDQARTFFYNTLSTNLGGNYSFVRNAVRSASLLNELAQTLDYYVGAAVGAALVATHPQGWTYRGYFDNQIFGPAYNTNLANFRATYWVSRNALLLIYNHFTTNIQQACTRILADRTILTNFFSDMYEEGFAFRSLEKIKSTGSDFHKDGKQVLILTFNILYYEEHSGQMDLMYSTLKVVYKPSDIEADCLLAGDSAAINRVRTGFMTVPSLFEIYNAALRTYKTTHSTFTGEAIPIYRFLPMVYLSTYTGGAPFPVRDCYGYIQYLNNDLTGTAVEVFGYYPFGQSDYMIFKGQNKTAIVNKFYKIEGALSALACTFSILDIHIENLRVKNYLPYFIDLEISLTTAVTDIVNTALIDTSGMAVGVGGINGVTIDEETGWRIINPDTAGGATMIMRRQENLKENRLWEWNGKTNKQNIPVNIPKTMEGFQDGMAVMRAAQQANNFNDWFARLNNVGVRYIPVTTADFKLGIIDEYYVSVQNATGATTLQQLLRAKLTIKFNAYVTGQNPLFLALTQNESLADLNNLDIPVFYYRIGMIEIINSLGNLVQLPANIDINVGIPPVVTNVPTNIGRTTFFANAPTANVVDTSQVQILANLLNYNARVLLLRTSMTAAFNAEAPPNPVEVVPLN